ncbi:MAG: response regulator [Alphaproteobacteria bacterium]|nr:response regulator [Alphaproteobacteria bacterium]MCW5749565.1 response regulator [Alphaproteobacteria bacterium]
MRVLVIDDSAEILEFVKMCLEEAGHMVTAMQNAEDAIAVAGAGGEPFDVVVTDLVMPGMDGVELIKRLRQLDGKVRIVAMSGGARQLPAEIGLTLSSAFGADRTLYKPFRPRDLIKAIEP